jgi:ribosomal protein S18 acetylase RimI-like enzyme
MPRSATIRPAVKDDMPAVGQLAARLVRFHHALDPRRFLCVEPVEPGYQRWLTHELSDPKAVLVVAEEAGTGAGETAAPGGAAVGSPGTIVGYAYGRLEPRDWNALLDAFGALHDVYVAEEARAQGIGAALVEAVARELKLLGAPRIVLSTATQNSAAQRLFDRLGFRPTMIEMTRELG